ncbi:hypothetical protein [Puniceibacterium sp. IMCC21224]|uniref:hypothetical protein n=1 Tax=Puniceibacterium sp. IMCC21224 TaxID=1618204 RepID=UPI00064DC854|nr:hypothetical protein [Puniceibacterium sp. IMCC21224]KMK65666.1 hypothetical protein IMCC21224_11498 [Puniceibacterium sp. IMCC21224]
MFAFLQLMIPALVILTLVYIGVSLYSRSVRRGKLEAEWDEEGMTGDRDAWITEGLRDYDGSLRRKLILGVYVVPFTLMAVIIYLTNFH